MFLEARALFVLLGDTGNSTAGEPTRPEAWVHVTDDLRESADASEARQSAHVNPSGRRGRGQSHGDQISPDRKEGLFSKLKFCNSAHPLRNAS